MKPIRLAADRWNFELAGSGEPISPLGGNILNDIHPGDGTLFDAFDAADCDRRLGLMAGLGLNCLRQAIGVNRVFDAKTGLKADGMANWDRLIGLAEKHGIYLMPVGGYVGGKDWFDVELLADSGKALDDSCAFWEAFAGHYRGHPAIWAWDLRNELLYWNRPHALEKGDAKAQEIEATLNAGWPGWLEIRYGSVEAMNRAHGSAHRRFAEVPAKVEFVEAPFDIRAFDYRNYLNARGYDWCSRQCEVIRAAAPGHLVVSGNNTWLCPDSDLFLANGFHNRALHDLFDFVTFHPYPACQCTPGGHGDPLDDLHSNGPKWKFWLASCIATARYEHYGKPVVVQEFGWYGGGASRFLGPLPYRSEEEHAEYTRRLCEGLMPHVNGFLNWPTMDMPAAADISNHGGLFTHEGKRKKLAAVYEELAREMRGQPRRRAAATVVLSYSLLGLYTSRPYQDRMWEELGECIRSGEVPDIRFV